jgi:hypothetical protein
MDRTVDVTIPVEPEAAAALADARTERWSVDWSAACCDRARVRAPWLGRLPN